MTPFTLSANAPKQNMLAIDLLSSLMNVGPLQVLSAGPGADYWHYDCICTAVHWMDALCLSRGTSDALFGPLHVSFGIGGARIQVFRDELL